METQNDDSSRTKTHEEILQLFHDVQEAEEKVRNPGMFQQRTTQSTMVSPRPVAPSQTPREEQRQSFNPQGEISSPAIEGPYSFLQRREDTVAHMEKKIKWFTFFKKEKPEHPDSDLLQTGNQPELEKKSPRSTFVLQLDAEGKLVGFPQKKSRPEKKTVEGITEAEEEQAKGTKKSLRKITSRFRRKKSEEPTKSSGIGARLKGRLKRKSEE